MAQPRITRASVAIQCRDLHGNRGTFLFIGNKPADNRPISPVCADYAALLDWIKVNGWKPRPNADCPTGEFVRGRDS
jgi:hypothetical protein